MSARSALLLAALASLAACRGPEITYSRDYPFSRIRRVSVARFEGPGGEAASDHVAHALLREGAALVERGRLEAVLAEVRLGGLGVLDPATVKKVGRVLGVDALFLGSVTTYLPPRSFVVYTASEEYTDPKGTVRRDRLPRLMTSSASVGLSARLVDVESAAVIWSAHQSYEGFDVDSALAAICESFARSAVPLWRPK